jgi:cell division protein FtsX
MTDRHSGFLVTLHRDIRDDDAAEVMELLRLIRGVADVRPVPADHSMALLTEIRRDLAWRKALHQLANEGVRSDEG